MIRSTLVVSMALALGAPAFAQTVNNTDLKTVTGGTSTTITDATGTRTTVTGARQTATDRTGWFEANLGGGATTGITTDYARNGNGSAFFNTVDGNGKADLQFNFTSLVALSSIQSVSFDWFRDAASDTGANFSPVLRFEMFKDGAYAGSLILEHVYQQQQPSPEGAWTTESATLTSGIFWATREALGPTFASANGGQKTLAEWIAANAGSTLSVGAVNIGVGSGWSGTFRGAVDNVAFNFAGGPSADVNFEVAAAAVPEPATWAMMIGGFGLVGGAMRRRRSTTVFA